MTAKVRIHGRGRLRRNGAKVAVAVELAVSRVVDEALEEIADEARIDVPVDTGLLKSDIGTEVDPGGRSGRVGVFGAAAEYAPHVEHGTSDTDAQPFMLPAAERERARLPRRVRDEVREALR